MNPVRKSNPLNKVGQLKHVLSNILTHNSDSPRIILAGDFNLPNIHWGEGLRHINPSPVYGYEHNSLFAETMNHYGF